MDTPTNTARALIAHLGRGAPYGYFWRKSDRTSQYYDTDDIPQLPVGQDVYFGVHPVSTRRPPHERGRIGDVAAINCLFSEFDAKDFGDLEAIQKHMETLALWPTVIVHSGGGIHAYWLLNEPWLLVGDTEREEAAALQSEFVRAVGGDPGARDLARVLRVPGTLNAKYDPPREVVIAEYSPDTTYTLAELREWVQIMRGERQVSEPATAGRGAAIEPAVGGAPASGRIAAGGRNVALASLAGSMRRRGMSQAAIEAALQSDNLARCDPPLTAEEVSRIAASVARYEPAGEDHDLAKDYGHAAVLATLFKDRYRWAVHRGAWMQWTGAVWRPVPEEAVAKQAADDLRRHYAVQAAAATDKATLQDLARKINETCVFARVKGALSFLRGWDGFLTLPGEWDKDPWVLNVRNGTLDLRACTLRPHDPGDLLTQLAPVDYDPEAQGPRWQQHLETFLPSPNVRRQVQRDLGVSLVGADLEEILPIWYGTGGNGKSTTLRVLRDLLGDYAKMAAPRLLIASAYERHPAELADLCGCRVLFSVEIGGGARLDEERVKTLTGGENVKARFMREDFFEFARTWTITLVCNHKPEIRGTDNGIWRRIRLIPWTVALPRERQRPQEEVVSELLAEGPAILGWLVEGLRDWQRDHHWVGEEVRAATDSYRAEQDVLGGFIADRCETGARFVAPAAKLYEAYLDWCEQGGEEPLKKATFGKLLRQRGFSQTRQGHGRDRGWLGLRLVDTRTLEVRTDADVNSGSPKSTGSREEDTENVSASVRIPGDGKYPPN